MKKREIPLFLWGVFTSLYASEIDVPDCSAKSTRSSSQYSDFFNSLSLADKFVRSSDVQEVDQDREQNQQYRFVLNYIESRIVDLDRPSLEKTKEKLIEMTSNFFDDKKNQLDALAYIEFIWWSFLPYELEPITSSIVFIEAFYPSQYYGWFAGFIEQQDGGYSFQKRILNGLKNTAFIDEEFFVTLLS